VFFYSITQIEEPVPSHIFLDYEEEPVPSHIFLDYEEEPVPSHIFLDYEEIKQNIIPTCYN
jgi:hypothetical protein